MGWNVLILIDNRLRAHKGVRELMNSTETFEKDAVSFGKGEK